MFHTMNRKRSFVVALSTISSLLIFLVAYQNCGGSLTALSSSGSTRESLCDGDGECSSVVDDGDETPQPPEGNEGEVTDPDLIVKEPLPEEPLPELPEEPPVTPLPPPSENQWIQVAKRTKAQKTAGLSGGEGFQRISYISYAPSNANIAYFTSDINQVWKSIDGGTSWQRKGGGYPANGALSFAVDPANENIVYAAGSVMGWWNDQNGSVEGIIRTTDGGDTWTLVKQAHFHFSYAYGSHIAFAGTHIYAAPSTGGILKSTNGTTWNLLNKSGGGYILDTLNLYNITAHPTNLSFGTPYLSNCDRPY